MRRVAAKSAPGSCGITEPDELELIQASRSQPDTSAILHSHLHAIGAPIGKQVGMVQPG